MGDSDKDKKADVNLELRLGPGREWIERFRAEEEMRRVAFRAGIHVAGLPPQEDFYIWQMPSLLYPNCAVFRDSEKMLRLQCQHGHRVEFCWEDFTGYYHEQIESELKAESNLERRCSRILAEWNIANTKSEALTRVLLNSLNGIPMSEIREESFYGADWPSFLRTKAQMIEALGNDEEAKGVREDLAKFTGPFEIADRAVGNSEDSARSGDRAIMEDLKSKMLFAIESKVLERNDFRRAILNRALGNLEEALGDRKEAVRRYELALALDPNVGCRITLKKLLKAV